MCNCASVARNVAGLSLKQESAAVERITALFPGTEQRPNHTVIVKAL